MASAPPGPTPLDRRAKSVLIVGVTGGMGLACLEKFADLEDDKSPQIHGFCRDKRKLDASHMVLLDSVVEGDGTSTDDLERAIDSCKPAVIILAVGSGESDAQCNVRAATARATIQALMRVEQTLTGSRCNLVRHVPQRPDITRVIAISRVGAGGSRIQMRPIPGLVRLHKLRLRRVLKDHNDQELALLCDPYSVQRTTILRPTTLTQGGKTGHVVEFGKKDRAPSLHIDREDLASYIVLETLKGQHVGCAVNVTGGT